MQLKEYLRLNGLRIKDFAELLGYSRTHMNEVMLGRRKLPKKLSNAIERATNGQVKADEIVSKD